jgi:tRNA pseudouridine38-40 synthase
VNGEGQTGVRRGAGEGAGPAGAPAQGRASGTAGGATWRLDLAYEGSAFRGWARQPGERTVQAVLEDALATVLRERVRLSVAGRTDAGVHAWAQVASFRAEGPTRGPERLRHSLNALLPEDVAVLRVAQAPPGFVARVARSRTYQYRLWLSPVKPLRERAYVWPVRGPLDVEALQWAAALLPGTRDFAALTASAGDYHSCVRRVFSAGWAPAFGGAGGGAGAEEALEWVFTIRAGSFLHNMVRIAVGSMVDVAQGRMTPDGFAAALAGGERRAMGRTAPARGLALVAVEY